ncbi:hypothetical protein PLANTIT3_10115 [Plantibacter sp. T3]|nr:hypothetical protein PLANTIT3_10115 [Plantibacter sp. T3]
MVRGRLRHGVTVDGVDERSGVDRAVHPLTLPARELSPTASWSGQD